MFGKKSFQQALGLSVLTGFFLISCTNPQDGGLITDAASTTDCPQNSCAQGLADPGETKILLQTPISNVMAAGSSFAEVSGECYASLYPQNFFETTVTYNGAAVTNYFPTNFVPRCNQGKFYFPISLEGGPNGTYNFSAQIVLIDDKGTQIRPPFKTITSTLIKR